MAARTGPSEAGYPRHRTPTEWRNGLVDPGERPPHEQTVLPTDWTHEPFTHTQFPAHLDHNLRYGPLGELILTMAVPYQFKHLAEPLTNAFGLPLSVDIQLWAPYKKDGG